MALAFACYTIRLLENLLKWPSLLQLKHYTPMAGHCWPFASGGTAFVVSFVCSTTNECISSSSCFGIKCRSLLSIVSG